MRTRRRPVPAPGTDVAAPGDEALADAVCESLRRAGASAGAVARLARSWTEWALLEQWVALRARWSDADVGALMALIGVCAETSEVEDWIRLGPIEAGLRLALKNVYPEQVQAFRLDASHTSANYLEMLKTTRTTGIHRDDLLLWHAAGVVSLDPPYLNQSLWRAWRAVGTTRIGMRTAALAAAAGLTPTGAVQAVETGQADEQAWRMLAGLRAGTNPSPTAD